MTIYDAYGNAVIDVTPDDSSYRHREVMGENALTLKFSLAEHVEVPVGSWCEFGGDVYTLARPESLTMHHSRSFEYTLVMEGAQWKAGVWKFRDLSDGRLSFALTAGPLEHLTRIVDNLNAREAELLAMSGREGDPEPWVVGECVEHDELCIGYDHDYCIDALARMAEEFGTEYEFSKVYGEDGEDTGKRAVSLRKVEYGRDDPIALSYGRGNGLKPDVGRSNSSDDPPVEVLYAQGGSDNIDAGKYPQSIHRGGDEGGTDPKTGEPYEGDGTGNSQITNSTVLLLPPGRVIGYDGEHFYYRAEEDGKEVWYYEEDGVRYYKEASEINRYAVDEQGFSISRMRDGEEDMSGRILAEDSLDCSEIYPKRVGVVGEVIQAKTVTDGDGNESVLYDFTDADPDGCPNYSECMIGSGPLTVIFQSGNLAGREFDVTYFHEAEGSKAARRFEVEQQEVDGVLMPDGDAFSIQPDDRYAVFGCMLPGSYICDDDSHGGAEWDMLRACVEHMSGVEGQRYTITGKMDGIWSRERWGDIGERIRPGEYVLFTDPRFQPDGLLIRITGVKDYINSPQSPELELSNETVKAGFVAAARRDEGSDDVADGRGYIGDIPMLDRGISKIRKGLGDLTDEVEGEEDDDGNRSGGLVGDIGDLKDRVEGKEGSDGSRSGGLVDAMDEVGITLWGEDYESGERSGGIAGEIYGTDDTYGISDMVRLYQTAIENLNDAMTAAVSSLNAVNSTLKATVAAVNGLSSGVKIDDGGLIDVGFSGTDVGGHKGSTVIP